MEMMISKKSVIDLLMEYKEESLNQGLEFDESVGLEQLFSEVLDDVISYMIGIFDMEVNNNESTCYKISS